MCCQLPASCKARFCSRDVPDDAIVHLPEERLVRDVLCAKLARVRAAHHVHACARREDGVHLGEGKGRCGTHDAGPADGGRDAQWARVKGAG